MSTQPRPLHVVLGAGPAGTSLAAELVRRGHPVRLVDRSGTGEPIEGVERRAADVATPAGAQYAVEGGAVIYHCVNVGYHLQVEVMPQIQRAVLRAVEAIGARLVVLDTLYPYGPTGGVPMTEDTPWNATTRKGRMRADLDAAYLAAHREGRARVVLGRSADFVGPGVINSSFGGAVFPGALTAGPVLALGDIDLPHSYTDIREVAAGLATLGEHPEADGRVWHLPTAPARTTREVLALIAGLLDTEMDIVLLEEARPFGPFDDVFMNEYAEMFYQHTEPQIMDSTAFQHAFGTTARPLETTVADTLEWFRAWLGTKVA